MTKGRHGASFRDPSGFIFLEKGQVYRQVNRSYESEFNYLDSSGLLAELVEAGLLVKHVRAEDALLRSPDGISVIRPETIPLISYPHEWSFHQLQDAALVTLDIQKRALAKGMSLKDANAKNIQFLRGKPVLIDTLSFEIYQEGKPWVAYRQFCQHFLAPLILMAGTDGRLNRLTELYADGIPLDLAAKLSPFRSRLSPWALMHLHLHARAQRVSAEGSGSKTLRPMPLNALLGLIDNLSSVIRGIRWNAPKTEWSDYYGCTNYSDDAMSAKKRLVGEMVEELETPATAWDLGANDGEFSRLLSQRGIETTAWDLDAVAVDRCYERAKAEKDQYLLPLVQDFSSPSTAAGWQGRERLSFFERGRVDLLLALALVHHLAIGNNVPLDDVSDFFARLGDALIVEFVPKDDSQVQRMLTAREDIFGDYSQEGFEQAFEGLWNVLRRTPVPGTTRSLYLMRRKGSS